MADYTDLIARLEKATAPSRRLDAEIIAVIKGGAPEDYEATSWALPRLTESLDAALTLVPEEANCHGYDASPAGAEAYVSRNNVASGHWLLSAVAATPALALCAAALKARQAGG